MEIKISKSENEYALWNDFVLNNPHGSIFQTTHWLKNVSTDWVLYYVEDNNGILGGFLTSKSRKHLLKGIHIPPYTPVYGPVWREPLESLKSIKAYRHFIEQLIMLIDDVKIIDLLLYDKTTDLFVWKWNRYFIRPAITFQVTEPAYNINMVHKSKSRYIKKLLTLIEKEEIKIQENPDLHKVIDLQIETAKRAGFNSNSNILRKIVNDKCLSKYIFGLAITTKDGEYLSGCIAPTDNYRRYHLINASKRNEDSLLDKTNLLLTFLLVKDTINSGQIMDFEGSMVRGVEEFYKQMGGEMKMRYRFSQFNIPVLKNLLTYLS